MGEMLKQSWESSWYIYLCMIGVSVLGICFVFQLERYASDFKNAFLNLQKDQNLRKRVRDSFSTDTDENVPLFSKDILQRIFEEYRKERINVAKATDHSSYVAIDDYFNINQLDEIGKSSFCELIPGTMTGLGILGTFLGLVIGISGFDTATTETITSSISDLLGGMGTAFLTSISGVFLSLLFSYIHKMAYNHAKRYLECFVDAFHDQNLDGYDNNAESQLLGFQEQQTFYQSQQTELLKSFAVVVSDAVSSSISSTMKTELTPIFNRMEQTIEMFGRFASSQQKEGLDKVVQEFIRCMNESLKGQFEELGHTIESLCEWQRNSVLQMQKIVDGICDTSTEIEKINTICKQTVEEMNSFVTRLNELQAKINEETELARQQIEKGNEINDRQASYIDKLVESQSSIGDLAEHVRTQAEAVQQSLDLISDHCKSQLDSLNNAANKNMEALADSTKVLVEHSHQQLQSLASTAQNEMQLLSETAASLSEENHNQLLALTNASSEQLEKLTTAANTVMQNSQQQISAAIEATQAQSESLMEATNDFVDFVKQEHDTLVDAVSKEVSGLANFSANTITQLQNATAGMETSAKLLDKNLDSVLERTFTSFDQNLADISQHLSGTIADVRDATDALPQVLNESHKQYKDVLTQLVRDTQNYSTVMQQLTAAISNKLTTLNNSEEGYRQ